MEIEREFKLYNREIGLNNKSKKSKRDLELKRKLIITLLSKLLC